jgi:hypothetical protein
MLMMGVVSYRIGTISFGFPISISVLAYAKSKTGFAAHFLGIG